MQRRTVLKGVAGTVGLTALDPGAVKALTQPVAGEPAAQAENSGGGKRPNIVFFLGEGLQHNENSISGNPLMNTPNIDRIGREGCLFPNAFVTNALCSPSRCTIMTGLYGHTTGAVSNVQNTIPKNFKRIYDLIREAGYEMAFIGKAHIAGDLKESYWDYYFSFPAQANYYRPTVTEGIKGVFSKPKTYPNKYVDELLTEKAVAWLQQKHDKPFCLFFWFYAPHTPFYRPADMVNHFNGVKVPVPPGFDEFPDYKGKPEGIRVANNKVGVSEVFDNDPRSLEELVKDHYCGALYNDYSIGQCLNVLEDKKLLDDTAIVFSADHGFFLGEHRFYDKRIMYEQAIRVPLMIRYPERVAAGTRSDEMVLNLDLAPTLLDIAGVNVPSEMQGHSVMQLAEAKPVDDWRKDWLYEYYEYPGWQNIPPHRGVRNKRYKYIHYFINPQAHELYDLEVDPNELNNLYDDPAYKDLAAQLDARLQQMRGEFHDHYQYKPTGLPMYDNTSTL